MTLPTKLKTPYLTKVQSPLPRSHLNRETRQGMAPAVGGELQGKKAYSTEMMWARGLARAGLGFEFQYEVTHAYTLPGQENTVDFLVEGMYPTEIDGEIAHKTDSQVLKDMARDALVNDVLSRYGIQPIERVDASLFRDQEYVDRQVRELYL